MRLATWNVESIRAHQDQVLTWVQHHDVDVLCLQETRADERVFPRRGFEEAGYQLVVFGGEGGRGGVAVASRREIDEVVRGIPGAVPPLDEARSVTLSIGSLRVHTCYAPNGRAAGSDSPAVQLAWLSLFAAWLEIDAVDFPDRMMLGDLNVAPADADVWDASRYRRRNLTSPPERAAFDRLLATGLEDVVRARLGAGPLFTWWNRRGDFYETDRGWRLDHVLASPGVTARVASVRIDRAERGRPGSTDHAPILIGLDQG